MSLSPTKPIVIKGVKLTFLSTKTDIYKNENCFFKIRSKDIESKLSKLNVEGYKMPWFEGKDGKFLLKAKLKMSTYLISFNKIFMSLSVLNTIM